MYYIYPHPLKGERLVSIAFQKYFMTSQNLKKLHFKATLGFEVYKLNKRFKCLS